MRSKRTESERKMILQPAISTPIARPVLPDKVQGSGFWYHLNAIKAWYLAQVHWSEESIRVMERRFPSILTAKKTKQDTYPKSLTPRKAIEYIESTVSSPVDHWEAFTTILTEMNS